MSVYKNLIQPLGTTFYGFSQPMIGSVIPGVLRRYPVRTVNYPDGTILFKAQKTFDPVTKFHGMGETHGKGHPVMNQLKKLLRPDGPHIKEGYERVKEDLSWKGTNYVTPVPFY